MASRPPPPALRRLVFGVLFVVALIIPLALLVLVGSRRLTDSSSIVTLVRWWSAATTLLLIWAAIQIREEPNLARFSLYWSALLFAGFTLFAHVTSNTNFAKSEKGKNYDLATAIVGKWQLAGHAETCVYNKDGTFVLISDEGKTISGTYSVPDSSHLKVASKGAAPGSGMLWKINSINDTALTSSTSENASPATYVRVK